MDTVYIIVDGMELSTLPHTSDTDAYTLDVDIGALKYINGTDLYGMNGSLAWAAYYKNGLTTAAMRFLLKNHLRQLAANSRHH